jgi:L,D-transpeptidase YcbB
MKVLRCAAALYALAVLAGPSTATARVAIDSNSEALFAPSPRAQAVEALLAEADDGGDPIEAFVLDGVRSFYASRNFELVWLSQRQASRPMVALRRRMDAAAAYGLDPADYATPILAPMYLDNPALLAEADVQFSRALARFVTHLSSGRIRPADVSSLITLEPERPDIGEALSHLSRASSALALNRYEPQHPQYRSLRVKLAELQATEDDETRVVVPEGALLRPGAHDPRVPLLRLRLGLTLEVRAEPELYDGTLVEAVKAFQAESGLTVDGVVGPRTLFAMNGVSREDEIASIVANLERWRWMPRELGAFHVMVNVPEFVVRVVDEGSVVHSTRVVVGTPKNPTPTFSNVINHLVVNPFWHVPTSIVSNEMLPEIRQNPGDYFSRRGYQVLAQVGGRMRVINPYWIDWWSVNPRAIRIRQVPGDFNALGRIKFMFPNQHSVYLHDTPSKSLFERDFRAFSHGCVRVENPLEFADAILPVAAPEWNSGRLERLYGGPEQRIDLEHPVPVHLSYFTVWIGEDGKLHRFEDLYGYDSEIRALYGV